MGCVESRLERDLQTNIFHVVNVHERGQRQRSARLEVTETHLVLHQRGRAPTRWPLRCLHRYGFDAEQFIFESCRRCPTWPGIYYFKLRNAESLFNMLQLQIQNIVDDAASRDLVSIPSNPDPRELSRTESRTSTVMDSQGYLETHSRPHARPLNSLSNIGVGPIASPPPLSAPRGANGGVGGITTFSNFTSIGSSRSPGSPPAPTSPPAMSLFGNLDTREIQSAKVDERDDPRPSSTPGTDLPLREPPSTPTETSRNVFVNYIDRTVSFINSSDRPSSYSSSGSDRPVSSINHVDRSQSYVGQGDRTVSYYKNEPLKPSYSLNTTSYTKLEDPLRCRHLYINVDTDISRYRDHVYENLVLDKDMPIVPPRSSLMPGSGGSGSSHSGTTTTTYTDQHNSQINYIQLELDRGSDSSQTDPFRPIGAVPSVISDYPRTVGTLDYALINFDKTEALSLTAKWLQCGKREELSREEHDIPPYLFRFRHSGDIKFNAIRLNDWSSVKISETVCINRTEMNEV